MNGNLLVPIFNHHFRYQKQNEWELARPDVNRRFPYQFIVNAVPEYFEDPQYIKDLLDNPDLILNAAPSVSYITEELNTTYNPSGFILEVPKESFFAGGSTDIGTPSFISLSHDAAIFEALVDYHLKCDLPSPRNILTNMTKNRPDDHNELFTLAKGRGMHRDKQIKIIGIFVFSKRVNNRMVPIDLYNLFVAV